MVPVAGAIRKMHKMGQSAVLEVRPSTQHVMSDVQPQRLRHGSAGMLRSCKSADGAQ
jgi:hypothetical protein